MDANDVIEITRELLYLAVLLSAPGVGVSLLIGVFISVFQTLTSIQEQTLSFAPRIVAVVLVIILTLPWMLNVLVEFTIEMLNKIGQVTL